MTSSEPEPDLGAIWRDATARLPAGWRLDSLRCASTGLDTHQRSDDWIAVGRGPDEAELLGQGPTAGAAVNALVEMSQGQA